MVDLSTGGLLKQLAGVVSIIPQEYLGALLALHDLWDGTDVRWIVNGTLAELLRVVDVTPERIEILCTKHDAQRLFDAVKSFNPQPIHLQTQRLPQNAVLDGHRYPVYSRSYTFEFTLKDVSVKVQGDLQFRVGDWDWGDTFEFQPEYVIVVGKKTAVTPLAVLHQLYSNLGWTDKAQRIEQVLQKRSVKH